MAAQGAATEGTDYGASVVEVGRPVQVGFGVGLGVGVGMPLLLLVT